jgi:hypothetical protein
VQAQAAAGRVTGKDKIGVRTGKVISKYKVAKHFILDLPAHFSKLLAGSAR